MYTYANAPVEYQTVTPPVLSTVFCLKSCVYSVNSGKITGKFRDENGQTKECAERIYGGESQMDRNRIFSDDLTAIIPNEEGMPIMEWLAEQMPGGFFIYRADDTTELLYVNQSTCDIFGCDTVEEFRNLTGNTFKGMVHPDDYDVIQSSIDDQIANSIDSRAMDYVVYRIIRKDGTVRWVDDYGHFATLPGYGEVYYVFIGDITDTRVAEEEKERAQNLALALEEAEHANYAKSAFLSNMSHEIRTPITAILGMNEMIQREAEDSAILEYSENIRKAGVSLLGIISDILDFSKIETGRMELSSEEYSLSSLVVDLYNLIRFRTEAKGLDLSFVIDPDIPHLLLGDEVKVKQVITNLLTNAAKYTEKGRVVLEIKCAKKTEKEVTLDVSVTDTGIGIRKVDMERLFEPFDRLDLKKTRSIEGSGLGLAITRQLLMLMDSRLEVESRYEEGSRFFFTIRQQIADPVPVGKLDLESMIHESAETGKRHGLFTAPGMKLLVVDDTPMNLQVLAGLLKRTHMHIDVATSGAECIEKFAKEHYDMVFLDYRMPQMNGIETLEELKKNYPEKFEKTPVISLTASAVSGDKEKMLKAGFTDYLSKPVNIEQMERMMIKYLPEDSVIISGDSGEDDEFSKLPQILFEFPELDPVKGMDYCGDADDYIFALETYAVSVDVKASQIEEYLKAGDMESYILNVHSLKSTSGAIGAVQLFEMARELEAAAKKGDCAAVSKGTPVMLAAYRELKGVINKVVSSYAGKEESPAAHLAVVEEEKSRMLAIALEAAERANMAKTAFLSNMSHEIRTPMNAIIGLYNIALRNRELDHDTRQILTKIGDSAKHLLSLINDILDMTRIESGHAKLKQEEFDFGSMLEQVNTMTEAQSRDKGIEFCCSVLGQVDDRFVGDDMKLKQIIINILGNAVKYTPSGGRITFTVDETERTDDKAMIRFVVSDTGVGMDEDYIPKIFEPFSKEKEGSSNNIGSTGLGMAICKNIVDMMCGTIEVKSKKGEGSRFVVTVPLGLCNETEHNEEKDPAGIRALVVDDDPTACEHAVMVLKKIGIEADQCLNGRDALMMIEAKRALKQPYRIVLVDWKMPKMDGIELTRRIVQCFGDDDISVVLTTYNWDSIMDEAIGAGVDGFIAKPLFAGSVKQEISRILSEKERHSRVGKRISLAGCRVLLAEDMEINAQIMKQILNMKDIRAELCTNGLEAVEKFEESKEGSYDAILMDIRMPKLNGLDAAKRIRSLNRSDAAGIPIIALTANAFDEDVQLSLEAGMNAHLSKPVEPDALFMTLEKMVRIRRD